MSLLEFKHFSYKFRGGYLAFESGHTDAGKCHLRDRTKRDKKNRPKNMNMNSEHARAYGEHNEC